VPVTDAPRDAATDDDQSCASAGVPVVRDPLEGCWRLTAGVVAADVVRIPVFSLRFQPRFAPAKLPPLAFGGVRSIGARRALGLQLVVTTSRSADR